MSEWLFLTNQARVLLFIAQNPASTARRIAQAVGITERATQRLIRDLDEAGYISRTRVGRHNEYVVHRDQPVSGEVIGDVPVSALIDCLVCEAPTRAIAGPVSPSMQEVHPAG
ncbi:MAG TPA: helix-turn-helix domain-containing protein [Thermomicrobiales bacterium]|nr:helix-turn-helix domain-containing protein [Thermomicrobiales bacterium]